MVIGVREGILYKLQGKHIQALVHHNDNLCELFHRRLGHLHYRVLSILIRGVVTSLLEFNVEYQGVCRECALGNNAKATFQSSESSSKGVLDIIHSSISGTMSIASM